VTVQPTPQTGPRSEPVFAPRSGDTAAPVDGLATTAMRPPHVLFAAIVSSVRTVLFSDEATVRLAVGCFVAGGHLLVEDFPGLGKTTLAKALAYAFGLDFRRVQFTADLLPADITGAMVFDVDRREPTFRSGPIFTNILMADELNRASPRAQSALLEAMEERQVTVDGRSFALPSPFMVVATQNPYDAAGTSPLPHGQRDRFLLRLSLGYPTRDDEDALVAGDDPSVRVGELVPALSPSELQSLMRAVAKTHVAPAARAYLLDLVRATRTHPSVSVGASPRATMSVVRMARAMAVADGRSYVNPEDIRTVAGPALAHRLLLHAGAELAEAGTESIVAELLQRVPVPLVDEVTTLPTP
jgi:MoxR-like ATPase